MDFKNKVILAPMAGATDAPMRRLCFSLGADMAVTEMVSARAICYNDEKTGVLSSITEGEGDVALQLFGHEPDVVAQAAEAAVTGNIRGARFASPPAAIDLNMGCPVKKIVSSGDGSALMKDPKRAEKIVSKTSRVLSKYGVPLTVKIRSGWDKDSVNAPYFAALMANAGASAVAVHARTRDQMYAPFADIEVIKAVKDELPDFPVIGNGDISTPEDAIKMLGYTGCDSVMIGRAALGNPWIFSQIKAAMRGDEFRMPSARERVETALSLIREIVKEKGEYVGIREARGRAAHFIKGMRGAPGVRDRINRAESYAEIEKIMYEGLSV